MVFEERKKRIGEHIALQRKKNNMTQEGLLKAVFLSPTSTPSLRKWEKGEAIPDLETLSRMATVFGCDMGYLLADYEEEHRIAADVAEETGLSEEAIKILKVLKDAGPGGEMFGQILSLIIETDTAFQEFAIQLRHYITKLEYVNYQLKSAEPLMVRQYSFDIRAAKFGVSDVLNSLLDSALPPPNWIKEELKANKRWTKEWGDSDGEHREN